MRLYELQDPYTKTGQKVNFKISQDSDPATKPAWRVDEISAFIDGERVGYIKLSWIPEERFKEIYPSIINWASEERGYHFMKEGERWPEASPQRKAEILNSVLDRMRIKISSKSKIGKEINDFREKYYKGWMTDVPKDIPEDISTKYLKALEKMALKSKVGEEFQRFKEFFVDKPIVDYIRVFDPMDTKGTGKDYRRQGIGRLLYRKAGEYLDSLGLKLHASGLQSDEAKAAWADLERRGLVEPGDRRTLKVN